MKKKVLSNEGGFTLIEIIAVLVLLGILAVVAVPRYMSIMDEAKVKAGQAGVAEGMARANQWIGSYILSNAKVPTVAQLETSAFGADAGDFTLTYTAANPIVVTATGKSGTPVAGSSASGSVALPTT